MYTWNNSLGLDIKKIDVHPVPKRIMDVLKMPLFMIIMHAMNITTDSEYHLPFLLDVISLIMCQRMTLNTVAL